MPLVYEQILEAKRKRMKLLLKILESHIGDKADKALAWFRIQTGLREEKSNEYLRDLVKAGIVTIEDGIIKEVKPIEIL